MYVATRRKWKLSDRIDPKKWCTGFKYETIELEIEIYGLIFALDPYHKSTQRQ